MNRVSLSAIATALLLANSAVLLAQEKTMTTSTGMELVWIPPGEFMLGSTPEERAWAVANGLPEKNAKVEGEQPRRTKISNGFWLGRTEVTTGQWRKFAEATGYVTDTEKAGEASLRDRKTKAWSRVKGVSWRDPKFDVPLTDQHPACYISWNDAVAFCEWLTETERKSNRLPAGFTCRLPTESEWEYSCRAGTQTKFWWGDAMEEGNRRLNRGDGGSGFDFTSPADHYGAKGRNGFGLADMLGNAWEWCLDDVDPIQAHEECFKGNDRAKVLRGGSFSDARTTRSAYRRGLPPFRGDCEFGFRVCIGVPGGSGQPSQNTAPLVAVVPPLPPTTASSPPVAKVTTPPAPIMQPPAPTRPQVTTVQPPAMRVVGVKQTTFEVSSISSSSQYACINESWKKNALCIEVALRVNEDIGKNPPNIKAYFFNKDRELVSEHKHPTAVSFGNRQSIQSPERFHPGRKYTVYFGIPESIQRGKDKWKHVIVVFGSNEKAAADIYPKEDINPYDFPEKDLVLKGRGR